MTIDIVPFHADLLPAAGALLAQRHRRDRGSSPALPARFEDPAEAHKAVEAAWQRPWASGVAAVQGQQLAGYLFADATFDQLSGRTAWIRTAGYALSADIDVDFYRDLYAAAAPKWLELGCFTHCVLILAGDRACLDVWYALSFGQQQAHGLRPITAEDDLHVEAHGDITIRQARPEDHAAFAAMALFTATYQTQAPIWAPLPAEIAAALPEAYAGVLNDETAMPWLALRGEELVGFQIYYPAAPEDDDLFIPERCAELPAASTRPEARGQGIGRALSQIAFKHLWEQGYTCCLTDWRTTNLHASRFWPRQGFHPTVYRLVRQLDPRITWAKGSIQL